MNERKRNNEINNDRKTKEQTTKWEYENKKERLGEGQKKRKNK